MQKLVELSNLLIYNLLLKLAFRFCPPFVHENFNFIGPGKILPIIQVFSLLLPQSSAFSALE